MLQEGAASLVSRLLPPVDRGRLGPSAASGAGHLLSLGITGWQDAIVGQPRTARAITCPPTCARRRAGTLLANVVGALWWDRDRGLDQLPELLESGAARARRDGSGHQREDDAGRRGREPHRGDAGAVPRRPMAARPAQRPGLHRPAANCPASSPRWTAKASRFTSTRWATAPSAMPWTRWRRARHANGARGRPASPGAPSGCASRRHPALRRAFAPPPTSSRCGQRTSRRWTS